MFVALFSSAPPHCHQQVALLLSGTPSQWQKHFIVIRLKQTFCFQPGCSLIFCQVQPEIFYNCVLSFLKTNRGLMYYRLMYTPVQKVLGRFEVSKDVYVKSFKKHAFDPLLSNRTTDYYHDIFIRHCLYFKAFQLRHGIRKKIKRKIFLGQKYEHGIYQAS